MTGQGRRRPARMSAYATASSHLALLSDLALERVVDQAPRGRAGIGGASAAVEAGGVRVFVKQVPVTGRELRPGTVRSTANLFGLPGFYQYGLGSAGFGAWRELAAHIMTTNWVLSGEHRAFALLYHWRLLPGPAATQGACAEFGGLDGAVARWDGSAAVRDRLQALRDSPARLVLFLEHVPQTLAAWMPDQDLSAFARVGAQLAGTAAFMRERGLVHFDAHFLNILTDGHGLYFSDFGLALSDRFDLTGQERAFLREHRCYDRDYTAAHLVNHHLADRVRGERDRRRFVRAWAEGDRPRDVPASAAAILTRYAGTAAVFTDFHHRLMEHSKQTPYPRAQLERIRARTRQHKGLTTDIA
jgi:hypothetical protein